MKHLKTTTAAMASVALLAGCANGDAEPTPTVTVTETVTSAPEERETEEDSPDETESAASEEIEEDRSEDAVNERGNLPMPEHSPYILESLDGSTELGTVEVSEISTDVQCTSDYAPTPEGKLLSLDFTVTMESELSEVAPDGFWLSSDLFQVLDRDGEIVDNDPGSTLAAYSCPSEGDQFPYGSIRPGTSANGVIVLESSVDSGYVVYDEIQTGEHLEWEFEL